MGRVQTPNNFKYLFIIVGLTLYPRIKLASVCSCGHLRLPFSLPLGVLPQHASSKNTTMRLHLSYFLALLYVYCSFSLSHTVSLLFPVKCQLHKGKGLFSPGYANSALLGAWWTLHLSRHSRKVPVLPSLPSLFPLWGTTKGVFWFFLFFELNS